MQWDSLLVELQIVAARFRAEGANRFCCSVTSLACCSLVVTSVICGTCILKLLVLSHMYATVLYKDFPCHLSGKCCVWFAQEIYSQSFSAGKTSVGCRFPCCGMCICGKVLSSLKASSCPIFFIAAWKHRDYAIYQRVSDTVVTWTWTSVILVGVSGDGCSG